jgi:chromosome segregation ATPase
MRRSLVVSSGDEEELDERPPRGKRARFLEDEAEEAGSQSEEDLSESESESSSIDDESSDGLEGAVDELEGELQRLSSCVKDQRKKMSRMSAMIRELQDMCTRLEKRLPPPFKKE